MPLKPLNTHVPRQHRICPIRRPTGRYQVEKIRYKEGISISQKTGKCWDKVKKESDQKRREIQVSQFSSSYQLLTLTYWNSAFKPKNQINYVWCAHHVHFTT